MRQSALGRNAQTLFFQAAQNTLEADIGGRLGEGGEMRAPNGIVNGWQAEPLGIIKLDQKVCYGLDQCSLSFAVVVSVAVCTKG